MRYFAIPLSRFSNASIGIIQREGGGEKERKGDSMERGDSCL